MKQNTYLSALLTAGLFLSSYSYAAGECLAYAGSIIPDREFSGSSCPVTTYVIPEGDVKCEVVRTGDFICIPGEDPVKTTGGPWKYTGGLYQPPPDTGTPSPLPPMELPPLLTPPTIQPSDVNETNSSSFVLNTTNSLTNLANRMNAIAEFINADAANSRNDLQASAFAINNNISNTNSFIMANTNTLLSAMSGNSQGIRDHAEFLWVASEDRADLRHIQTSNKLNAIDTNTDTKLDAIQEAVDFASDQTDRVYDVVNQNYYEITQLKGKADNLEWYAANTYGGVSDLTNISYEILNTLSDGGSGGGDMEHTNDILNGIKEDANNNTDRIVNAVNNSETLSRVETELMQTNGRLGGLSGQLGQQLNDIKTAIENGGGSGGSDDDTETNQKLDGLGEKLDGIGEGIDGLADSFKTGTGQKSGPDTCQAKDCWRAKSWVESPYPEGIKTIWDEHKQAFEDSSVTHYLAGFNPVINGATFESSWQLCFNFPTVNLGCHDLSIPPYILTFIRLLMLVSAGFLCRRLIFGG